jgi:hypothetical protein
MKRQCVISARHRNADIPVVIHEPLHVPPRNPPSTPPGGPERQAVDDRLMGVPYLACMAAVAAFYHLPPRVLPAIQAVEGGRVGTVHLNQNGTSDLGVMQVNTIWLEPLAELANMRPEAVRARLVDDPCFNIAAAGAIMRTYLRESGGDLMTAVGFYHSHTSQLSQGYLNKVLHSARIMFGSSASRR